MSVCFSPELEAAEREIDNFYRSNPLVKLNFATAAWNLMAFAEDMMLKPIIKDEKSTPHESNIRIDNLLNNLK